MGHPSPKYTAEFKQRAVELYRERGCTYAELAREPSCDAGSISDRVKRADAAGRGHPRPGGGATSPPTAPTRPSSPTSPACAPAAGGPAWRS